MSNPDRDRRKAWMEEEGIRQRQDVGHRLMQREAAYQCKRERKEAAAEIKRIRRVMAEMHLENVKLRARLGTLEAEREWDRVERETRITESAVDG